MTSRSEQPTERTLNSALGRDWTVGEDGRSNSSELFVEMCRQVERLIRGDAHKLIGGRADMTASLIVAQLAHVHGMRPAMDLVEALESKQKTVDVLFADLQRANARVDYCERQHR